MRPKLIFWILLIVSSVVGLVAALYALSVRTLSKTPATVAPNPRSERLDSSKKTPLPATALATTQPALGANPTPLSPEQQARFDAGKELYPVICGACHQPAGLGQEGLAPPLAGSEWVTGSEQRLIRIALQGARGPMTVKNKVYELDMPPMGILEDDQLASLLTYIRREWGHLASPIDPAAIKKVRDQTEKREEAWTERELLKIL